MRRVIFVRHRLPSLILIAFDTYPTTYRSWSGLQILPLGAVRKLILPPIRRRQDKWQQTYTPLDSRSNGVPHASVFHRTIPNQGYADAGADLRHYRLPLV